MCFSMDTSKHVHIPLTPCPPTSQSTPQNSIPSQIFILNTPHVLPKFIFIYLFIFFGLKISVKNSKWRIQDHVDKIFDFPPIHAKFGI